MPNQEPFLDVIQSVDWEETPLGRMEGWHPRIQQTFKQIIVDSRPIAIFWGPSRTVVYNEAYSKCVGSRHPTLLGKSVNEAWPEAASRLEETMETVSSKKRATLDHETRYFVPRADGSFEETYLKWSIIPISEGEEYLGFLHPVLETTSMRLWERRMKMLIDLGEVLASSRDVKSYWRKTVEEFESVNPNYDVPLAILYSVEDDTHISEFQAEFNCDKALTFEGSVGVPEGHPIIPAKLHMRTSNQGLSSCFRRALQSTHPILAQTMDGSLPEELLGGLDWRGFGDPCRAAVICPIRPTKEESVMGLLFLGLNPRRPYDNDYKQYISLLNQKLTTSLASTVLLEEETRRRRNVAEQAAYDQAILKKELAYKQQEANESMQRFRAVAEFVPIGMCFGDTEGNISYANDAWYRITGQPRGVVETGGFLSCVLEEDRPNVAKAYAELQHKGTVEFVFRVSVRDSYPSSPVLSNRPPAFEATGFDYYMLDSEPQHRFVSAAAKVERRLEGSVASVLTCLTDVTIHKRNADEAIRRAQQAENLKRMAELSTVGMYDMDLDGNLISANNVFYEMCGIERTDVERSDVKPWEVAVHEEDLAQIQKCLKELIERGASQSADVRLRTPLLLNDGAGRQVAAPRWVNATLMPIKSKSGVIESFTGCFSDVSLQKWQLQLERDRKEEAIESKRLQDSFIDMTSHEMRNPLSAVIHCADAVINSLRKLHVAMENCPEIAAATTRKLKSRGLLVGNADAKTLVADSIDNGETIISCAQHQKRIVDDILTMSKLDSKLLAVTPITVDPIQIVQEALKMFSVEARRIDIDLSMFVDKSYRDMGIKFLDIDPSRMKQVLINLLTNALKFTKAGSTRNVSVTIRASKTRPTSESCGVEFIPRRGPTGHEFPQPALEGRGDTVFLIFEVQDTGQGLTDEEKVNLFQRFGQASVKTHVKYGGSGLGLFISRALAELQRGSIGVSSRPGIGSNFTFFIEAYQPTADELEEASTNQAAVMMNARDRSHTSPQSRPTTPKGSSRLDPPAAVVIEGILVVEDNLVNQRITKRGLQDAGYDVYVANHGAEALEKIGCTQWMSLREESGSDDSVCDCDVAPFDGSGETTKLSIVLMDIEMPVMDGLTCTRSIRELESKGIINGHIPIIAVSANARTEQILQAKAAGCDDVLVKPYRMPELIEKMQVVIRRLSRPGEKPSRASHYWGGVT